MRDTNLILLTEARCPFRDTVRRPSCRVGGAIVIRNIPLHPLTYCSSLFPQLVKLQMKKWLQQKGLNDLFTQNYISLIPTNLHRNVIWFFLFKIVKFCKLYEKHRILRYQKVDGDVQTLKYSSKPPYLITRLGSFRIAFKEKISFSYICKQN